MNLAICGLPSNMKSSSLKTWQTSLLFLKPLQIQNLKRKKRGDMAYYVPPVWKSGGTHPLSPTKLRPCSQVTWLLWVISSYLYTSCGGVSCLQPSVVGTCDWSILWRFGSIFCGQRHRCTHTVGCVGWHFFSFSLFYVLSLNTSLRIFLASSAAATFQHGILRSLVFDRASFVRITLAGECLSSCSRAISSFLAHFLLRNTKCIEFGASTFKVEFTLTSVTRCNSVLSLCDNFRCHYPWPTCRLTVLTTSLAQLYTLKLFSAAILLFCPRTSSASFTSAAATSAVFAGRGQSVSEHLINVSEFQRHHTEDWKNFLPQFPSSTSDC